MALLIKKPVTSGQLGKTGCYIQIKPYLVYGLKQIPVDRAIWGSKADYDANQNEPTINSLIEVSDSFKVLTSNVPTTGDGKNVLDKMLYWISVDVKTQILAANPTWVDADIEIVDIPKS